MEYNSIPGFILDAGISLGPSSVSTSNLWSSVTISSAPDLVLILNSLFGALIFSTAIILPFTSFVKSQDNTSLLGFSDLIVLIISSWLPAEIGTKLVDSLNAFSINLDILTIVPSARTNSVSPWKQ